MNNNFFYNSIKIFVFLGLCSFFREASTFEFPDRFHYDNCGIQHFRCANGDCIPSEALCDGKINCTDHSDETRVECLKPEIRCQEYAFKCSYGACVDGDSVCNGVEDCADGSDETLRQCRDKPKPSVPKRSTCRSNQFKCANGQCIDETNICDGSPDCSDRSDETETVCGSIQCGPFSFKCNYGACIDADLKCNGVRNCADGSDEDSINCGNGQSSSSSSTTTTTTARSIDRSTTRTTRPVTTSTYPTRRTTTLSSSSSSCITPEQPRHGQWTPHTCKHESQCKSQQGISMEPGSQLIFECDDGFKIEGSKDVFCSLKGKWSTIPKCLEIRCEALDLVSTKAECRRNGEWTSCETSVLPGTMADLSCHASYRQDASVIGLQGRQIKCNAKGRWEPEPIQCIPECGKLSRLNGTALIVNGTFPNITEVPWHATLYKSQQNEKEFICGATIITENLVVTAAHCVYDDGTHEVANPNELFIAAGNIYRDYDSPYHDLDYVQRRRVKRVFVDCDFSGASRNYQSDIAILQLNEPFYFSLSLVPICLDTRFKQKAIEIGGLGLVAGFGRTAFGSSSFILQKIHVPVIPSHQCTNSTDEHLKFLTLDKFCAGYTNGSAVCNGDSGGGLVFKSQGLSYLRGIVSVGVGEKFSAGERTCDSYRYTLYTEVASHIGWIEDVIFKLKTDKSYPDCKRNSNRKN